MSKEVVHDGEEHGQEADREENAGEKPIVKKKTKRRLNKETLKDLTSRKDDSVPGCVLPIPTKNTCDCQGTWCTARASGCNA